MELYKYDVFRSDESHLYYVVRTTLSMSQHGISATAHRQLFFEFETKEEAEEYANSM